jgi:hypothetical protein
MKIYNWALGIESCNANLVSIWCPYGGRKDNRTRRLKRENLNGTTPADSHVQLLTPKQSSFTLATS